MTEAQITVRDILARCGGASQVASRASVSIWAVYKWYRNGVPQEHWDTVMDLSGASPQEIYHANRLAKTREGTPAAA